MSRRRTSSESPWFTWTITKQMLKQSIGRGKKSQLDASAEVCARELSRFEVDLKKLVAQLQAYIEYHDESDIELGRVLVSLGSFGSFNKVLAQESSSNQMQRYVLLQQQIARKKADLMKSFKADVFLPLNNLLNGAVNECVRLRRDWEAYHLAYDSAVDDLKEANEKHADKAEKISEAERAVNQRKSQYKDTESAMIEKYKAIEMTKSAILSERLREFLEAERQFYLDCADIVCSKEATVTATTTADEE